MEDKEHIRIANKLAYLDALSVKVAIGFIVFWILYGLAWGVFVYCIFF